MFATFPRETPRSVSLGLFSQAEHIPQRRIFVSCLETLTLNSRILGIEWVRKVGGISVTPPIPHQVLLASAGLVLPNPVLSSFQNKLPVIWGWRQGGTSSHLCRAGEGICASHCFVNRLFNQQSPFSPFSP